MASGAGCGFPATTDCWPFLKIATRLFRTTGAWPWSWRGRSIPGSSAGARTIGTCRASCSRGARSTTGCSTGWSERRSRRPPAKCRQALTDAVIEDAVRRLPGEWYAAGGAQMVRDLERRRDLLPQAAQAFYERLAKYVDVQGTDRADVARLTREADGSATLELSLAGEGRGRGPAVLQAPVPAQRDGGDPALPLRRGRPVHRQRTASAASPCASPADRASTSWMTHRAAAPASTTSMRPTKSSRAPAPTRPDRKWTRIPHKPETPWMDKKDFGSLTPLQPLVWWEPDPGVVLAFGVTHYRYGFRKQPYSSMQQLGGRVEDGAVHGRCQLCRGLPLGQARVQLHAGAVPSTAPRTTTTTAWGTETPTRQDAFTEADQQALEVVPFPVAYQNPRRTFSLALGPEIKFAPQPGCRRHPDRDHPALRLRNFGQAGARLRFQMDTRSRSLPACSPGACRRVRSAATPG